MSEQENQTSLLKVIMSIIAGIILVIMVHLGIFFVTFSIINSFPFPNNIKQLLGTIFGYFYICLFITQLIYVIPLYLFFKRRSNPYIATGIIVGAVITALVNGGCYLIFTSAF